MHGNSLQQAINTINDYLAVGNTLYLFNETNGGEHLRLNEGEKLGFVLSSGNFKVSELAKVKDNSEYLKIKDNFDWRDVYR